MNPLKGFNEKTSFCIVSIIIVHYVPSCNSTYWEIKMIKRRERLRPRLACKQWTSLWVHDIQTIYSTTTADYLIKSVYIMVILCAYIFARNMNPFGWQDNSYQCKVIMNIQKMICIKRLRIKIYVFTTSNMDIISWTLYQKRKFQKKSIQVVFQNDY